MAPTWADASRAAAVILALASNVEDTTQQTVRRTLNKLSLILLMSLATAGAYAQGTSGGVTMSTDPARAAAVEKHAEELKARQSKEAKSKPASKPAPAHASTKKTKGKTATTHKSTTHASTSHKSSTHKSSTTKTAKAPKS
jgi:hypothetical protein